MRRVGGAPGQNRLSKRCGVCPEGVSINSGVLACAQASVVIVGYPNRQETCDINERVHANNKREHCKLQTNPIALADTLSADIHAMM